MGAFADVLVLLLMLCIVQRTVEFFCEDMQKFSIEVTELEIKRDYYLNKLVAKNIMALLRSLLECACQALYGSVPSDAGPINENKKERVERLSLFMSWELWIVYRMCRKGLVCIYVENGYVFTILQIAPPYPWTLPRAKNCSPALNFCTSLRTGAALSSPSVGQK